jgi:hypothetical protein
MVKIAGAFTNDLLSNPQKAIFKPSGEIAQPPAGAGGRWHGVFRLKWRQAPNYSFMQNLNFPRLSHSAAHQL